MAEIGWKTVRSDYSSISTEYGRVVYTLGKDGPGPWVEVSGNGAYVAVTGGLFTGGCDVRLLEVECEEPTGVKAPPGVVCYRKVRVLRECRWTDLPLERGEWRCQAATDAKFLRADDRRQLAMTIPESQSEYRYRVARDVKCLTDADRATLVKTIPALQYALRFNAAREVAGLSVQDRAALVDALPAEAGEMRFLAARDMELQDADRRALVAGMAADQTEWRKAALVEVACLTEDDKRTILDDFSNIREG